MSEATSASRTTNRILGLNAWLVYIFLYAPIVLLIFFSFNGNDNVAIWTEPSLRWYREMFQDDNVMGALRNSLIVALFSTIASTVIGTMLAIALERYRFRGRGTLDGIAYLPIIIPDVTMAVMLLIFFFQAFGILNDVFGTQLKNGLNTITLSH
ncbi:MAG: spermidine/putrescine ABC transporter permease PotC, partial [Actinomycetota bacterium]|nr:spermidine/putrescine ABC transporter permease PotC [Actinomycetota bacterium]